GRGRRDGGPGRDRTRGPRAACRLRAGRTPRPYAALRQGARRVRRADDLRGDRACAVLVLALALVSAELRAPDGPAAVDPTLALHEQLPPRPPPDELSTLGAQHADLRRRDHRDHARARHAGGLRI